MGAPGIKIEAPKTTATAMRFHEGEHQLLAPVAGGVVRGSNAGVSARLDVDVEVAVFRVARSQVALFVDRGSTVEEYRLADDGPRVIRIVFGWPRGVALYADPGIQQLALPLAAATVRFDSGRDNSVKAIFDLALVAVPDADSHKFPQKTLAPLEIVRVASRPIEA